MSHSPAASVQARRAAASRRRNAPQREWERKHAEALARYAADRKEAIANKTKLPNYGDYMPANNW